MEKSGVSIPQLSAAGGGLERWSSWIRSIRPCTDPFPSEAAPGEEFPAGRPHDRRGAEIRARHHVDVTQHAGVGRFCLGFGKPRSTARVSPLVSPWRRRSPVLLWNTRDRRSGVAWTERQADLMEHLREWDGKWLGPVLCGTT